MLRGSVQDITDRKRAELEVHEKTLLLERAQQVGGVGSWAWYPGENREVWSEEAQRIFGFTPEEAASGDPELFYGVVHPDDRDRIVGLTWESFDTRTPSEIEYRILRRSDGALRWVREQAVAELDTDGTPLRVLGAVIDITEQRAANKELERLAFSDPLTGLPNRTSFHRCLDLAVEQADRGASGNPRSSTSISTTSSS
jgi:PAS domain S-box-containing protein